MNFTVRVLSAQQSLQLAFRSTPFLVHLPPLQLHLGCTQDLPCNPAPSENLQINLCKNVQQNRRMFWGSPEIVKRIVSRHLPMDRQASADAAIYSIAMHEAINEKVSDLVMEL